jgi:hypothetical protein
LQHTLNTNVRRTRLPGQTGRERRPPCGAARAGHTGRGYGHHQRPSLPGAARPAPSGRDSAGGLGHPPGGGPTATTYGRGWRALGLVEARPWNRWISPTPRTAGSADSLSSGGFHQLRAAQPAQSRRRRLHLRSLQGLRLSSAACTRAGLRSLRSPDPPGRQPTEPAFTDPGKRRKHEQHQGKGGTRHW